MDTNAAAATDLITRTEELCSYFTCVVDRRNEQFLDFVGSLIDLDIYRYPSGSVHMGWVIPHEWRPIKAEIRKDGELVYDGMEHYLGVAYYSRPFEGRLSLSELKQHLFSSAAMPDNHVWHCIWLYRPLEEHWGFSLPHNLLTTLPDGDYDVCLETEFIETDMLVAEHTVPGKSPSTIVFAANSCHPHMANDGFSALAVQIELFEWIAAQDPLYTYKLIITPEIVGTAYYLKDRPKDDIDACIGGVFAEMMGTPGPFNVASSMEGNTFIDRVFRHVTHHYAAEPRHVGYRETVGNDESIWEGPGYEVPMVQLNRARNFNPGDLPYPEYHTDADNPALMDGEMLQEFLEIFKKAVRVIEENAYLTRRFNGVIALSNPQYDLYPQRLDPSIPITEEVIAREARWGRLVDRLFRYLDGDMTLLDIAELHDIPFFELLDYFEKFEDKGLITLERRPVVRTPPKQV